MIDLSKFHAVIVDDGILKAIDIRKALNFNRITNVDIVSNQEKLWEAIYESKNSSKKVDLIVTDMQYPLMAGGRVDKDAGFKLIERMKEEQIEIPVIICSTSNYEGVTGILGSVWYRGEAGDSGGDFKEVLGRI